MKETFVCSAFWKCKTVIQPEDPRVKIGLYTYCAPCAEEKKK